MASIDSDLARLSAGQVRYQNQWISRAEFERSHQAEVVTVDFPSLTVGLKTYRGVQILKIENESASLKHEGGVARVKLAEVGPEFFKKLYSRPELLQAFKAINEITIDGVSLRKAILMTAPSSECVILHEGGVSRISAKKIGILQKDQLLASNPTLSAQVATSTTNPKAQTGQPAATGAVKFIRSWGSFEVPNRLKLVTITQDRLGETIIFTSGDTLDPGKRYDFEELRMEVFSPNLEVEEIGNKIFSQENFNQRKELLSFAKPISIGRRNMLQIPHANPLQTKEVGGFVYMPMPILANAQEFAIHWIKPINEMVVSNQVSDGVVSICNTLEFRSHTAAEVEANHLSLLGIDPGDRQNGINPFGKSVEELRRIFGSLQEVDKSGVHFPGVETMFIPEFSTPPFLETGSPEFFFKKGSHRISALRMDNGLKKTHLWLNFLHQYFSILESGNILEQRTRRSCHLILKRQNLQDLRTSSFVFLKHALVKIWIAQMSI